MKEQGLIKPPQVETIDEVVISRYKITLIDANSGREVDITGDSVVDNETGEVIGYLCPHAIPLKQIPTTCHYQGRGMPLLYDISGGGV